MGGFSQCLRLGLAQVAWALAKIQVLACGLPSGLAPSSFWDYQGLLYIQLDLALIENFRNVVEHQAQVPFLWLDLWHYGGFIEIINSYISIAYWNGSGLITKEHRSIHMVHSRRCTISILNSILLNDYSSTLWGYEYMRYLQNISVGHA